MDRFFGHLGSILGAKLGPCWRPRRPKRRPRAPKSRPRRLPSRSQDGPMTAQEPLKRSRSIFGRSLISRPMGYLLDSTENRSPKSDFWHGFPWASAQKAFKTISKDASQYIKDKSLQHQKIKKLTAKRGGGYAALLRIGSAAPGLVPAHGMQNPIP